MGQIPRFSFLVVAAVLLAVVGCTGVQIQTDIAKAQVYETRWQNDFAAVVSAAKDMIPLLPVDQQQAKRDLVTKIEADALQVFDTKDAALLAALQAAQANIDLTQFAQQVAAVIAEAVMLAAELKASPRVVEQVNNRLALLRADISRGALRGSATP